MTDIPRSKDPDTLRREAIPDELRAQVAARRRQLGITKKGLAERAGKVREVIYRIEQGQDVTVSSLVDVLRALGMKLAIVPAGVPSQEEVAKAFAGDDDEDA